MATQRPGESRSSLRNIIFYATIISGGVAAYLMYRRGQPLGSIAIKTVTNPVGSLVSEIRNSV